MNYDNLPKLTVILGAGASHDVANEGTNPDPQWKPPLAKQLFEIRGRNCFENLLVKFPGATNLVHALAPRAAHAKGFLLESELRELADHSDERVREQFKEVPAYIRAVVVDCTNQYVKGPGTYAQLTKSTLADVRHQVLFLVLNYDTYLESVLESYYVSEYRELEDYVSERNQCLLVKLHGSVDWFHDFRGNHNSWFKAIRSIDLSRPLGPTSVYPGLRRSAVFCSLMGFATDWKYPVLTAPLAGKGPTDIVCPKNHRGAAEAFLKECKKFIVIGTSGSDADLLQLLDTSIPPACGQVVHFVDPVDVHAVAQRFRDGVRGFASARVEKHAHGFARHMRDPAFHAFLEQ